MEPRGTVLRSILRQKHWQGYSTFCAEYDKAAQIVDPHLVGTWPSRPQLQRWLSGTMKTLPYPDHCRVLETMLPGWGVEELFKEANNLTLTGAKESPSLDARNNRAPWGGAPNMLDLSAVYLTRADFLAAVSLHSLFTGAQQVRSAGLSLNVLAQHYSDSAFVSSLHEGVRYQCLFLDPTGEAIGRREVEEGHGPGHLSRLTQLNIDVIQKVRDRLPTDCVDRLEIGVIDETIRFNLILVDRRFCSFQPYLPQSRGLESPTFVIDRPGDGPLFLLFADLFSSLWDQRKTL